MSLFPFAVAWGILALVVIGLAVYRWMVSSHEEDSIHISAGEAAMVEEQVSIGKKLAAIDMWGKRLTIVLAVTGLVLAVFYGIQFWEESSRTGFTSN